MWLVRGACRDSAVDPELFFPTGGVSGPALLQQAEAKSVCRRCPVVLDCLHWAMSTRSAGVWGGTSEEERMLLGRRGQSVDRSAPGSVDHG
ncbi:WhiB family transcriptional regulator [Pseudonocardia pini]|uniref:WhiB family transcriptional regulator n=1 Tax=Pseudonocardia pini TaxID=2758030 RepID=UPI0015F0C72D|nr:WhiB family transcriptional regulator [Pseudonocardia pini]